MPPPNHSKGTILPLTLTPTDLPAIYQIADRVSVAEQRATLRWSAVQLALLVSSPVFNMVTARTPQGLRIGAFLAAVTLGLALLTGAWPVLNRSQRRWYRSRALAESVKALAWRYTMRARGFTDDSLSEEELLWRLTGLLRHSRDITIPPRDVDPLATTPMMLRLRNSRFGHRREAYLAGRLDDQCAWYAEKARRCLMGGRRWLAVAFLTMLAGLTGSLMYALGFLDVNILDVSAVLTASVIAWSRLRRFQPAADAYSITARELTLVRGRIVNETTEERWADLCDEAETIISREHMMWVAREGDQ